MEAAALGAPPSPIDTEVRRIRALLERGQFGPALAAAQALRAQVPENRDVLYLMAVSLRYLQRIPEALATLAELERHYPDYSRLFQERGHCHVAMRSPEPAIQAFLRAVNLNPSLPASWNALQVLFRMTGHRADAENAAGQAAKLASLPPEILTSFGMFADGEIYAAEHLVRQYLLTHGNHIEGMRLLAQIGMKLDVVDDAELLLENVLVLAPDYHDARYEYALALLKRHKHVRARRWRNSSKPIRTTESTGPPMRRHARDLATTAKPCRSIVRFWPRRRMSPSCICRSRMRLRRSAGHEKPSNRIALRLRSDRTMAKRIGVSRTRKPIVSRTLKSPVCGPR